MKAKLEPGDLVVVQSYKTLDNVTLTHHTFVILSNEKGKITGAGINLDLELEFNISACVMSSIKNEAHKRSVRRHYPESLIVEINDAQVSNGNGKDGFIKANQLYYFNKKDISYTHIGRLKSKTFDELKQLLNINDENGKLYPNYNNIIKEIEEENKVTE